MNAESKDVVEHKSDSDLALVEEETAISLHGEITPMQMLKTAVAKGTDLAQLEKLMELERTWKADKSREAFVEAMSGFRGEAVEVLKTRQVSFGTGTNATSYKHAELADAVQAAVPSLSKWGLSHRWETKQENDQITVDCIITHKLGHSERSTLTSPPDASGGKNPIQAIGSTITYLERYTFMASTGLAAKSMDDDGVTTDPAELINDGQLADLKALLTELDADQASFLEYCGVDKLEDIPAFNFKWAVKMLERKRKK